MAIVTSKQLEVLRGLWQYLTTDNRFNDLLGGDASNPGRLWHSLADRTEVMPYCVYDVISSTQLLTFGSQGYRYRIQFAIYGTAEAGPEVILELGDELKELLHGSTLSMDNHYQHEARELLTRGPMTNSELWWLYIDFSIEGFPTA